MRRAFAPLLAIVVGCNSGPRPLVAGQDGCDYCRMMISDTRFGGELVTRTGRVHTFDSIECLASYVTTAGDTAGMRGIWVADFASKRLVPAATAHYVLGGKLHSPMGRDMASFAPTASADALRQTYQGEVISWPDVLALVRARGAAGTRTPNDEPVRADSARDSTSHNDLRKS
jgi:copper chaperone NosL